MSAAEISKPARPPVPLQRARGRAAVAVHRPPGAPQTRLGRLHQAGCLKLRFPRGAEAALEGVLINTAGGLTGGDELSIEAEVGAEGALVLTTQAAERIYRSNGGDAAVHARLTVGTDASLFFLPQETILFDGGRLRRRLDVDAAASSRLLLCESVVLGRTLMGETVRNGFFRDSWRIRRDGRLVFAEEARLDGAVEALAACAATLGGARAFATVLLQDASAESLVGQVRATVGADGGVSFVEGFLVARLVAPTGFALRKRLVPLLGGLANGRLPRVWSL